MLIAVAFGLGLPADADAQRKRKRRGKRAPAAQKSDDASSKNKKAKPKVFDFTALELGGRMRTPQLLYFLDRANEELGRAALERRSFVPEMTRSMQEEEL